MDEINTDPISYGVDQSILNKSREDKFIMVLNVPTMLRDRISKERSNVKIDFDALQFSVFGAPVPDITVPVVEVGYQGQHIKISSHSRRPYENIRLDFTVDNLYRNWWVVYFWLNILNDAKQSFYNRGDIAEGEAWEALQQYSAMFTIYGLDEYDNRVIQFDYTGAIPVQLSSPKYSDRNPKEIEAGFEFGFSFFESKLI